MLCLYLVNELLFEPIGLVWFNTITWLAGINLTSVTAYHIETIEYRWGEGERKEAGGGFPISLGKFFCAP